jgi:hypothetical protein
MADKKISALTASTTPLAGTEVLPIVQSGSTVKVAVSDLTAGRAVSALSITMPNTEGATSYTGSGATIGRGAAFATGQAELFTTGTRPLGIGASGAANLNFYTGSTRAFYIDTNQNFVVQTAGKGIDFSANTGTAGMTSEVLTWYEEGVFTATLTCTTGTITLNSGQDLMQYTRIGRMVYVSGQIVVSAISSPTGILTLGGLPFTVNGSLGELAGRGAITVVAEGVGITVNNVVGYFLTGGTTANIYKYAAGNTANMAADVTASSSFLINMWYVAA